MNENGLREIRNLASQTESGKSRFHFQVKTCGVSALAVHHSAGPIGQLARSSLDSGSTRFSDLVRAANQLLTLAYTLEINS